MASPVSEWSWNWSVQIARAVSTLSRRRRRCGPRHIDEVKEISAHVCLGSVASGQWGQTEASFDELQDGSVVVHRMRNVVFLTERGDDDQRHTVPGVCEITCTRAQFSGAGTDVAGGRV